MKSILFKLTVFNLIFVNQLVFADSACEQLVSNIINSNAKIVAKDYKRPFKRDLFGYSRFLGNTYTIKHDKLKAGAVLFDSGAGLGVASLEDATNGLKVYAINAQDFWGELKVAPLSADYDSPAVSIEELIDTFKVSLKGIKIPKEKVWDHGEGKEVSKPTMRVLSGKDRREARARLFKFIDEKKNSGNFNYLVGFAEQRMPEISESADLIRDLYGAYFYSADKMRLLDLYYSKLNKSGQAFMRLSTSSGDSAEAIIEKKGKKFQSFEDYLMSNFPTIFSIEDVQQGKVLVMKKDPKVASLNLSEILELNKEKTRMVKMNDTEVPESWFSFRKKK
jgi:hypothetical protein